MPVSNISAFCQAVLSSIIPNPFWGLKDDVQNHNRATFLRHVDRFIKLRRFETISLHEVMQGMKVGMSFRMHRQLRIRLTLQLTLLSRSLKSIGLSHLA